MSPASAGANAAITEFQTSSTGLVAERSGTLGNFQFAGLTLTPDGRYLIGAEGSGAMILSVSRIENPQDLASTWAVGTLSSAGQGAIESVASPDGRFAFVSLESTGQIAVFNLAKVEHQGFGLPDLVGYVPMGVAPVGLGIAPDGRYLYATSESQTATRIGNSVAASGEGTISTIDLKRAERDPSRSVISTVWAGCSPVRVVATQSSVFVTARGSNALLEFSAHDLISNPMAALQNHVQVGEAPVGLALAKGGSRIVVADSNRFQNGGNASNLAVVSVTTGGVLQLVGYLPTGGFPRDMAVSPNGQDLILSDYSSGDVEDVNVGSLP